MRPGWMRAILVVAAVLLAGVLLVLAFMGERIQEGRCRLSTKKADLGSPLIDLACQVLHPQADRPDTLRDLPTDFQKPSYYCLKSGDKRIPLVVNLSDRLSLCMDADGDGVLSRERCFGATFVRETKNSGSKWRFGPMSLASQDSPREAASEFYVDCYSTDKAEPLVARPASFRTGKLKLDGRTYRVAVVDGDYDGRFRSILSLPLDQEWWLPKSDVFAIDLNRNGRFETSWFLSAPSEVVPLGRLVQLADTYYALDVASDGTSLTLSRTEPQFGTLVIEPNDTTAQVRLWSDAAAQYLRGRQWQLPPGKYMGTYAALEKKDASGDVWSLSCDLNSGSPDYPLGPLRIFVIKPGETTRVWLGPPFTVAAQVRQAGGEVSLSLVILGCGGERYQASFQRNGRRVPEHTFKIVDEKGNVLVTDKFQYG